MTSKCIVELIWKTAQTLKAKRHLLAKVVHGGKLLQNTRSIGHILMKCVKKRCL